MTSFFDVVLCIIMIISSLYNLALSYQWEKRNEAFGIATSDKLSDST